MCDCESPRVLDISQPVARVPHTCCECRQTIFPGDRYEVTRGNWDGSWSTYRTCLGCARVRDWAADQNLCPVYRDLRSIYFDVVHGEVEDPPPDVLGWAAGVLFRIREAA